MRSGAVVRLVVFGLAAAAVAFAVAFFVPWLPEQASEERAGIDFVFWLTTVICVAIFAVVVAIILYCVLRFRVSPDDELDGPPIHGHTGLEIVWTAIPFVLVTAISISSAVVLARNDRPGDNPLRVGVLAQQFAWQFEYPNDVVSPTLRLPLGRSTELHLRARDVIHSFWVKEFGQKQDAVPGIVTKLVITPKRLGTFDVMCTELCGLGHALMRTRAEVMRPAAFRRWLRAEQRRLRGPPGESGAAVFEGQGCGSCHAFTPAGTRGRTGPNLDELEASARRAGKPLEEYVRESIVEPNAYVRPGFQPVMPAFDLPDDQLDALVQYLIEGRGGGS